MFEIAMTAVTLAVRTSYICRIRKRKKKNRILRVVHHAAFLSALCALSSVKRPHILATSVCSLSQMWALEQSY